MRFELAGVDAPLVPRLPPPVARAQNALGLAPGVLGADTPSLLEPAPSLLEPATALLGPATAFPVRTLRLAVGVWWGVTFMIPCTGAGAVLTLCRPPRENRRDTLAVAVDGGAVVAAGGGLAGWKRREGGGGGFGALSRINLNALLVAFARPPTPPPSTSPSDEDEAEWRGGDDGRVCEIVGTEDAMGRAVLIDSALALRCAITVRLLAGGETESEPRSSGGVSTRAGGVRRPLEGDDSPRCVRPRAGELRPTEAGGDVGWTNALRSAYAGVAGSGGRASRPIDGERLIPRPRPRQSEGAARRPSVEGRAMVPSAAPPPETNCVRARGAGAMRRARGWGAMRRPLPLPEPGEVVAEVAAEYAERECECAVEREVEDERECEWLEYAVVEEDWSSDGRRRGRWMGESDADAETMDGRDELTRSSTSRAIAASSSAHASRAGGIATGAVGGESLSQNADEVFDCSARTLRSSSLSRNADDVLDCSARTLRSGSISRNADDVLDWSAWTLCSGSLSRNEDDVGVMLDCSSALESSSAWTLRSSSESRKASCGRGLAVRRR